VAGPKVFCGRSRAAKNRDAPLPGRQGFFGRSVGTGAGPSVSMPRRCSGRPAQVAARPTAQGDELRRFVGLTSQVPPSPRAGWRRENGLDGTIGGVRAGRRLRHGRGFVWCLVPEGIIGRPGWLLVWKVGGHGELVCTARPASGRNCEGAVQAGADRRSTGIRILVWAFWSDCDRAAGCGPVGLWAVVRHWKSGA